MDYQNPFLRGWANSERAMHGGQLANLQKMQAVLGMQQAQEDRAAKAQLSAELANAPEVANNPLFRALVQSGNAGAVLPYIMPKPRNPVVVAPGASLVDPSSPERPLYTAPIAPREPRESPLAQVTRERDALPEGDPRRAIYDQHIAKLTTHAPAARNTTIVNPMRETFKDEQALRKEFEDASKSYIKLTEGYSKVKGALAADPTTSAPATLTAATQFMKMLDPDSVVRESELGMALAAAGVWDRFKNIYNTVQNGKVLTAQQAAEFGRMADIVYGASNTSHQARVQHFQGLARSYNFDPSRVVPDFSYKPGAIPRPSGGVPPVGKWSITPANP